MASFESSLCLLWICILAVCVHADDARDVFGVVDASTTLTCPQGSGNVEWYDWVYNLDGDNPATIYKDGDVNNDEYHGNRFSVSADTKKLTISGLKESDVGLYYCQAGGKRQDFQLTLGTLPSCRGATKNLLEGDRTDFECEMDFFGKAPTMEWFMEKEELEATDETVIGMAKQSLQVDATADKDGKTFICRTEIGDSVEECSLTLSVQYTVRQLAITPDQGTYGPGSEFTCSAIGNPVPKVKVTLPDGTMSENEGEVTVAVLEEWDGKKTSVLCEASNMVDGVPSIEKTNFTFSVSSEYSPNEGEAVDGGEGEEDDDDSDKNSTQMAGIIAGLVIGAVVLVIIIVAVVCIKRRQSKPPKGSKPVPTKEENNAETKA